MKRPPHVEALMRKHQRNGVVVDTNLLIVYLISLAQPEAVGGRRTEGFTQEDARDLREMVHFFARVHTTPHILTEVSNLLKDDFRESNAARVVSAWQRLQEQYRASAELVIHPAFPKFGLADAAIHDLADQGYLVLTNDFRLSGVLNSAKRDVLNYTRFSEAGRRMQ